MFNSFQNERNLCSDNYTCSDIAHCNSIFKLPVGIASGAVVEGFFQGVIPIGYIVMMAVLLYKITLESGQFSTIQDSITSISQDQRIQLLLIGFSFNAFLEVLQVLGCQLQFVLYYYHNLALNHFKQQCYV